MNYPLEFGFDKFKISAHLLFETLAFIIGFRYFLLLRKKQSDTISDSNRVWIIIAAIFGAFFFSRLIAVLENPPAFLQAENKLLAFYSGKTIVGGLLGGLVAVELTKKFIGEKHSSGDLFTFPLILAMLIGRIGCFSSGIYEETYGDVTRSFLGMNLGDGLMRHPVTLYEIVFLILIAVVLKWIERKQNLKEGYRFQLFMISYLIFRFLIDFIKPGYTFFWELGTIQICAVLGLLYYWKTILKIVTRPQTLYEHGI